MNGIDKGIFAIAALLSSSCTLLYGDLDATRGDMGADAGCACKAPPADQCLDSTALRVYVSIGSCASASCSYQHWDVLCENGCAAGACIGNDPCDGLSCIQPPGPSCNPDGDLIAYATSGTCSMGFCSYTSTQTMCTIGCANDACTNEPCAGVVCDTPPEAACASASTLTSYAAGTCENGSCNYAPVSTPCTSGCQNSACTNDPCAGVTCTSPPAATCLDANTRRSYAAGGMCTNGTCSYAPTDTTCASGCEAGLCSGNACAGVTCDQPPAATCTSSSSLRTFAANGTCSSGNCNYAPTDSTCTAAPTNGTATCTNGACGFTCNTGYSPSGGSCVAGTVSGGLTWTALLSGTTDNLLAVWGSGPNDVYAVGDDIILHSTNGGVSWAPTVGETDYIGIWGSGASDVYLSGSSLLHSSNSGTSWNAANQIGNAAVIQVWGSSANDVYALTSQVLYHSIDGGTTWSTPNFSAAAPVADLGILSAFDTLTVSSIWGSGANDVYLIGSDFLSEDFELLFHSVDRGATWTSSNIAPSGLTTTVETIGTIWGSGPSDIYVTTSTAGGLYHSTDGQNWSTVTTGSTQQLYALWGTAANNVYAAGQAGTLLHTTDGTTWSALTSGTTNSLNAVWGSSTGDVYIVGDAGTILHGH